MEMHSHGPRKYPSSTIVVSSAGRNWREIAGELRSHPVSDMPGLVPQQMEISIALRGRHDGWVMRTGAGERQKMRPVAGAIWLSPIGIADTDISITKPLPRILHLYIPAQSFAFLADEFNLSASPAHSIRYLAGLQDELIRQLGLAVVSEMCHETASGRMLVETCSLILAARLAHRYGDGWSAKIPGNNGRRLDDLRLRRVQEYVVENLEEDISVADLASAANLSVFHFTRLFTAATGMPPHRFVGQQRLERAMTLLAAGTMPLSAIALNARFSSQASFGRAFRRATGTSPGQYRRLFRHGCDERTK
jgi:AraC family transcriptional regulator